MKIYYDVMKYKVLETFNMMKRNLTMLTDFYELTMANGYFQKGIANRKA